ncbi:MAG: hypothetical protein AUG51_12485 [Acidobacteria bacterium 13_1_20CM_3_53_8]|nr:MAG: hypothetical protein AUG51_12485 [Acidobacteria bacterium 13_1_20CM_3_53_8]
MTIVFTPAFNALVKEAQFTKEMLGSGATQIRGANYATKGIYFQAFTSLSTGLERIGKLCLMLDYYIETQGQFPDDKYMKNVIGHKISLIYQKSMSIINDRSISLNYLGNLDGTIHQNILTVLSDFAGGDRYSNINLLVRSKRQSDPIASWFETVDRAIFQLCVSAKKKATIAHNAHIVNQMIGGFSSVLYSSESGSEITDVEDASYRTGMWKAVAPYRQLFVLQIIRFWVELVWGLQDKAMAIGNDIPFLSEIFAPFYNDDSYLRSRKTWDKI